MKTTDTTVIPADVKLAAKRGFVRTTYQAYAAALATGVSATTLLAILDGSLDMTTAVVTAGVALVSPPVAGLVSYLQISAQGIPEDYQREPQRP